MHCVTSAAFFWLRSDQGDDTDTLYARWKPVNLAELSLSSECRCYCIGLLIYFGINLCCDLDENTPPCMSRRGLHVIVGNTSNARLIRWTSTFEGQRLLCDWIPVLKTSSKANEWLAVIPPNGLTEERQWWGGKPAETLGEWGQRGVRRGTDPELTHWDCAGAVQREGRRLQRAWLMSVCGWWRGCVPTRPCVTSALNGFINLQPLSRQ